jgi:alanyl-tRNA synthetase
MCPPKEAQQQEKKYGFTPSEVKARARAYFAELDKAGKAPWPHKFLTEKGFHRLQCKHCHKNFWATDPNRDNCGDSECAGGYTFLHPNTPPEQRVTYLQAWQEFKKSMETNQPVPYTAIKRYPVVARWRSDVEFVAAGIYCFQPFCVTGESEPPANPLCACQFCLRFNDLDNIGITGRHYSGFNMLGIQVFNHADKKREVPLEPFGETEEIFWKDTLIANNYRWCTETLHLDPAYLTFIEDVWQGGGNCGACVEYFYGGLEIGNMVFTEYAVSADCEFSPITTKVVDVGIGLERIPWLVNGGWTSYLDVFDYCLPTLSEKLGVAIDTPEFRKFAPFTALFDVDENSNIEGTWAEISKEMGFKTNEEFHDFRERLQQFSDLVIVCDHTRTVLYAIEDGALPSNVGGAANIRNVLRRAFNIIKTRGWFEKLGGIDGVIDIFKMHMKGLEGFFGPFKNVRCLEDCIKLEWKRWEQSKENNRRLLKSFVAKFRGKTIPVEDWITQMTSNGVSPDDIIEAVKADDPKSQIVEPDGLWLKFDEMRYRTPKGITRDAYNVEGLPETTELFNLPEWEYKYEFADGKIIKLLAPNKVVVDKTILYATQGGQEHDDGELVVDGKEYKILDIEKVRKVVVFTIEGQLDESAVGKPLLQKVSQETREIMRTQHSATHLVAAAARKVLGPHVWQNGAKKTKVESHIDLTHFTLPSFEEMVKIQEAANSFIMMKDATVTKKVYTRKEAEEKWGFVLYQGGAIPGNDIRVVDMHAKDENGNDVVIDTEACCGTHVNKLAEISQIRILGYNSLQDGVFRIRFVAGKLAIKQASADMTLIRNVSNIYDCQTSDIIDNCNKFFKAKNALTTQVKNLTEQVINLEVKVCAVQDGDKFFIMRREENGSGFIKGIADALKLYPSMATKSVILLGPSYLVGNLQQNVLDALKPEIDAIIEDEKKKDPKSVLPLQTVVPKQKQQQGKKKAAAQAAPAPSGIPVQCMKLNASAVNRIREAAAKIGFQ